MNTTDISLLKSVTDDHLIQFSLYADKHDLYSTFQDLLKKLIIAKPDNPLPWIVNELEKKPVPNIIILAPPAADESDLCKSLAIATNSIYISASALLKAAIERKTTLGTQAIPALTKNLLVPDRVMIELVMMRLSQPDVIDKGWILEGFPRTREQAIGLYRRGVLPSHIFILNINDNDILYQNSQLHIDPVTNTNYDLRSPMDVPIEIKSRLVRKATLTEANILDRLGIYHQHLPGILQVLKIHNIITLPNHMSCSSPTVKQLIANSLQVRQRPTSFGSIAFHRIIIIGGSPDLRNVVCRSLEDNGPHLVYLSPRRIFTEEISRRGPNTEQYLNALKGTVSLSDEELIDAIKTRLNQKDCKSRGWVITHDMWTPGQIKLLINLSPSRVLILPTDSSSPNVDEIQVTKSVFHSPLHPYFMNTNDINANTSNNTNVLQMVQLPSNSSLSPMIIAERVQQLLLRPIEWQVPRDWIPLN